MMCEHEFVNYQAVHHQDGRTLNRPVNRELCCLCGYSHTEIELESQLAAANARVAELEEKNSDLVNLFARELKSKKQAEAQCAKLKEENSKLASAAIEQPPYKNDLLAQNKRMQTAINRYVIGNIELLDAMKAALEDKP